MKDYSLNFEDFTTFILNYKIENNLIIVKIASGENYVIPYTLKNEKKILEQMKKQVLDSREFEAKQKEICLKACFGVFLNVCILLINVMMILLGDGRLPIGNVLASVLSVLFIPLEVYIIIDSKEKIKDINKNRMFLSNEKLLNEKVKLNQNILSNMNTKTKELSLNDMDKIKYKELKAILDNIKRDEEFRFEHSSIQKEDAKVLTKKKNN